MKGQSLENDKEDAGEIIFQQPKNNSSKSQREREREEKKQQNRENR